MYGPRVYETSSTVQRWALTLMESNATGSSPVGGATRRCEGVLRTSRSVPSEAAVLEAQVHKRLQLGAPHSSVWPEFVNIGVQGRC